MTPRRALLVAATVAVLALPGSAAAAPPPAPPDPSCSPGPANCSDWHRESVTVNWSAPPPGVNASGCGGTTISEDTGGAAVSCTWSNADGARTTTVNVRKDGTPPGVTATPERGPDSNGWYNRPVNVTFSGEDGLSGVESCSTGTYSTPDSDNASVSGTCTDWAGNVGRGTYALKYDATAPTAEAKPERAPNQHGWYNRAVRVDFVGADATSGVDACAQPVVYSGPDTPSTAVTGTCRDKASNTSPPAALEVKYDTKPPGLRRVKAVVSNRGIVLSWLASKDALTFTVLRSPGRKGRKPAKLYDGPKRKFVDGRLVKGVKYRYTVTAYDQAGNGAVRALQAQAAETSSRPTRSTPARTAPGLRRPVQGARLSSPPLLSWTPVRKATYYNVQLYRGAQKILTVWPTSASYQLRPSWRFEGRAFRLTAGSYTWYVWPGFGKRSANRYGKLVGTRRFEVIRT